MGSRINNGVDSAAKFGIGRYRQGRGVLEHCGQEVRRLGKKAYVMSGPRAFDAVKNRLLPGLTEAGVEFVVKIYDGACSYGAAEALGKKCPDAGYDEVMGIGGGVIMDLLKAATEKAGVDVVNIPASTTTCVASTATNVMYTPQGAMKDNWRYEYETDGVYVDLDVIPGCSCRYAAAGILDAMAKKIKMLNGGPAMEPDTAAFDLYIAYRISGFVYDLLERYRHQVTEDIRRGTVTKIVEYVTYINITVTGIISSITRSSNRSAPAHMVYYGIRTCFTRETRQAPHGEIMAVGLSAQLHYNGLRREVKNLKEFMRHLDMPLSLREPGMEVTEANPLMLEQYLADSLYVEGTERGLGILHESIRKLSE